MKTSSFPLFLWMVAASAAVVAQGAGWKLVWADEFSEDGAPNPARWGYEHGFVRNQELQYYTEAKPENARVEDGMLVIESHQAHLPNPGFRADASPRRWQQRREFAEYTSASLTTRGTASWTYGRIEVRAKVPAGRGTWPAIWMLGTNIGEVGWPACGEIDILEHVGHEPGVAFANVHTRGHNHMRGNGRGSRLELPTATTEFHVYAVEWTHEKMDFLVDGQKFFSLKNDGTGVDSWPFDAPQYLILNLAIGGSWGGAKGVDATAFPQRFLIDYVRVYQQEGE
ncbi:MAG: glycoside hydrolase family 16 protein [Verrucomicrobiales bacterium]|nr:glycoside hydrolase family 16 protein [Verrucomicrobiales bacterium]